LVAQAKNSKDVAKWAQMVCTWHVHTIIVFVICTNEHVDSNIENVDFAQRACGF